MGSGATPAAEIQDGKMLKSSEAAVSLPKHSYWFDFWAFLLFDVVFFLFMYYVVP